MNKEINSLCSLVSLSFFQVQEEHSASQTAKHYCVHNMCLESRAFHPSAVPKYISWNQVATESVTLKFRGRCRCWHRMTSGPRAFVQSVQYSSPLIRSRSSPPSCPLYSCSHSYISSMGQPGSENFISHNIFKEIPGIITTCYHCAALIYCSTLQGEIESKCKCEWQLQEQMAAKESLAGRIFCLGIPVWMSRDSTLQSVFFLCLFSLFIFVYLFWFLRVSLMLFALLFSNCFHNKNQPTNKKLNLSWQIWTCRLILASHSLWVGFSCLSIKPCCALEDALRQLTWACICPEGHEVLSHLSTSWRHFHLPWGSWNAAGHLCLHNWISPTVKHCTLCKGWEKVSWWGFFDRKLGFYLFFCVVCAFPVGRIPKESLVVQHAHTLPEGRKTFSNQFHSSSLHQWLPCSVLHYRHLRSLAFIMK